MKRELFGGLIGTSISAVGTSIQTDEILQYISLVITIIGGLISMVIIPLVNWYKQSKKDGKIDKEELQEGVQIISSGIESIKENTKKEDTKE